VCEAVTFTIEGIAPLSFSRPVQTPKEQGEDYDVYESRIWREKMHVDGDGNVFIPPMMMKQCLESTAKYLSESVPGKGTSKFTKHFLSGIMVIDPILIGVKAKDVVSERLYVNADGKKGSGTRVWRVFPLISRWSGDVTVYITDPILQCHWQKVPEYAEFGGKFNGLGRFAPRRGGFYGRYKVSNVRPIAAKSS
jgi:hypothetical protein